MPLQCQMMFGQKVLPTSCKKVTAMGMISILAEFSIYIQMHQNLAP
jgi:hypothetical protein